MPSAVAVVHPPRTVRDLVRRRIRIATGNAQAGQLGVRRPGVAHQRAHPAGPRRDPARPGPPTPGVRGSPRRRPARRPGGAEVRGLHHVATRRKLTHMTSLSNPQPRSGRRRSSLPPRPSRTAPASVPARRCGTRPSCVPGRRSATARSSGAGSTSARACGIGERCKVQNQALVYEPAVLGDGVFIGPAVVLTNDTYPRAVTTDGRRKGAEDWEPVGVTIERGSVRRGARGVRRPGADRPVGQRRSGLRRDARRAGPRARRRLAREADRLGGSQRRPARLGQP